MKDYKAYGIAIRDQLLAVYLDRYYAENQLQYFRHKGNPVLVELEVTKDSIQGIKSNLKVAQDQEFGSDWLGLKDDI